MIACPARSRPAGDPAAETADFSHFPAAINSLGRATEANPGLLRAADLLMAERNQQGSQAVMQQLASPSPQGSAQ